MIGQTRNTEFTAVIETCDISTDRVIVTKAEIQLFGIIREHIPQQSRQHISDGELRNEYIYAYYSLFGDCKMVLVHAGIKGGWPG